MAKKTGTSSKKRNKDKRHLKAVPSVPKMPLQLVLNHRVIDSMAVEFMHWDSANAPDPTDAFECLELVKLFLTAQHAINGSSSATAIGWDGVEQAAGTIAASLDPDDMDEALDDIYFSLHSYIHFLKETGHWSGTDSAYEELHAVLGSGFAAAAPQLPVIHVPDLSDKHQDAAFNAMPLVQRASALLDWLGTGKPVTSTGALQLKDIQPAAAAVGVQARGMRGPRRTDALFELEDANSPAKAPFEVRSMHTVPVLSDIWKAMVGAGLISLGPTKAVPGPEVAAWNSAGTEDRLHIRRMLAVVLLVGVLTDNQVWDQEAVGGTLLAALTYGTTNEPILVADLDTMASLDLRADVDLGDAEGLDAPYESPGRENLLAAFAARQAQRKLSFLAELGLLEADIEYRVPPVAIQCVDLALGFLQLAGEPADESLSAVVALHGTSGTGRAPRGL